MSTGELARHFGCEAWQVRRLYERGLLPPARRIGRYRYVALTDLPAVEAALARAGYLAPGRPTSPGAPGEQSAGEATEPTPSPGNAT
jgi:hypothetical protein